MLQSFRRRGQEDGGVVVVVAGSDGTFVCVSRPIPLFKPGRTHFRDERLYLCLYHSGMPHALRRLFAWAGGGGASLPSPTLFFFFGPSHGRRGVA